MRAKDVCDILERNYKEGEFQCDISPDICGNKPCDLCVVEQFEKEIRADERRKVLHEQRALDVNLQISAEELRADERAKAIDEEPRIKAFSKIYDICDDMIHETEWYDLLARQKFDEIKQIVFDCDEQMKGDKE